VTSDNRETFHPKSRAAWRRWLESNCQRTAGVWVIFNKKSAGLNRLEYGEAVEEALCFGWVDSVINGLDENRYKQWFAPRKSKSGWSQSNKRRVEKLIAAGLMTPFGLAKIEEAKRNGAWTFLDGVESLTVPPDFAQALAANKPAARNFAAFSPSVRKQFLYRINSAKRPETRAKRVAHCVALLAKNRKLNE
jgi:uncharacterized protein YdeI (YjbR/CyaY-like superfamily)